MQHFSTTSFGRRPVTAALIEATGYAETTPDQFPVDKWGVFHYLSAARTAFRLGNRVHGRS